MNILIKPHALFLVLILFSLHIESKPIEINSSYINNEQDSTKTEIYSFPNPDEIMTYIIDNKFDFNESILSNPKESDQYLTDDRQNILVGIFLADLAYCIWLDQPAKSILYFDTIDDISKSQSLFPYISYNVKDRLIGNSGNIDSLKYISNDIYKLTKDYLLETERYQTYALVTMGSIIESLYLIFNSSNLNSASATIRQRIVEQQNLIFNLEDMLNSYLTDSEITEIKKQVSPIINAYKEMVLKKSQTTISDENNILIIGTDQKEDVDVELLYNLKRKIDIIRNNWLNP
ncbi:hypothetical protein [Carboxylicivirga caseinilyticus]|uniref:hypothetical protein n=1 Tax=Carboxylicivirga caseinilyticus TaxID=3417572 RepID=UPI003D34CBA6|nr:hypothetical protein [Marinilabiliaceae bacterium A049]